MKASDKSRQLLKQLEGWKLTPYICPAGKWTIGAGHKLYPKDQIAGLTFVLGHWVGKIAEKQAEDLLTEDIAKAENAINTLVTVPISQTQYDALTTFILNIGYNAFKNSTLLGYLNVKAYGSAARQFSRWTHDDFGHVLPGLVARRKIEENWFKTGMLASQNR